MFTCEVPPGIGLFRLAVALCGAMPSSVAPVHASTSTPAQPCWFANDGDQTTCPLELFGKVAPLPTKLPAGMSPKSGLGSAAASTIGARSSSRRVIAEASPKLPRPE